MNINACHLIEIFPSITREKIPLMEVTLNFHYSHEARILQNPVQGACIVPEPGLVKPPG